MDRYVRQIAAKLKRIEREAAFHEDTVISLVILIRQHIEANSLKDRFTLTAFYCDWCLHPRLDRSPVIERLLSRMDQIANDATELNINDRINESISLEQLRNELREIASSAVVNSSLFNSRAGWKAFLGVLLRSLIDKPIIRKETPSGHRFVAQLLLEVQDVSGLDPAYIGEVATGESVVFWRALIGPIGYWLTGPLVLTSSPESFDR